MKVAIIGRGLIGGSLEKAARRAGHDVTAFDKGETPEVGDADLALLAVPPDVVVRTVRSLAPQFRKGAVVVDMAGVKSAICRELSSVADGSRFTFVGGHPMAGRETSGYANSSADLFAGAPMVLTPFPDCPPAVLGTLEAFFASLGFGRVVRADPARHDEMIAFTSQLCHLISSAYVRESLAERHDGFSAGSFRDMVRVGAPDPDVWTELFLANRGCLVPVLDRYIARLADFRRSLAADDRARLRAALEEGVAAKRRFERGGE